MYDSHMHTPLCKHATGEPEEYAASAQKRGLQGIIITCHNPGPAGWSERVRMRMDQFDEYVAMVERARVAWNGRLDIRLGLESDYMPGMENWLEQLHQKADFNHILGSIHPQLSYYKNTFYKNGDVLTFQQTYFEHLAQAAETGLFDTLAHPDLIKNSFPQDWNINRLKDTICAALDRIALTGVAMELNTSGLYKRTREMNPGKFMLREMAARQIPVVIGSDAHHPKRVADDFDIALNLLTQVGYTHVSYYLNRQRHNLAITDVHLESP